MHEHRSYIGYNVNGYLVRIGNNEKKQPVLTLVEDHEGEIPGEAIPRNQGVQRSCAE